MESNGRVVEENEKLGESLPTPSPTPEPTKYDAKIAKIRDACEWRDIETLRTLATSEGGLVSDDVRRQACSCHQRSSPNLD
jgi:hypothetical protein